MQGARAMVKRQDGSDVNVTVVWFSGLSPIERHKLRPKERLTLAKKSLVFENIQGTEGVGFGGGRAVASTGKYRVRYESVLTTGVPGRATIPTAKCIVTTPRRVNGPERLPPGTPSPRLGRSRFRCQRVLEVAQVGALGKWILLGSLANGGGSVSPRKREPLYFKTGKVPLEQ
jgi:hypothetical protein